MANADGMVRPKPGIPKTLGILNVIFGVILVLFGICGFVSLLAAPMLVQAGEKLGKQAQTNLEEQNKAQIKSIDERIAAAKDEEEKKTLEQEKASLIAGQPKMNPVDMSAVNDVLKDPTIMTVSWITAGCGLILHILLLVSGIGLIRLTPWGRTLGVWWGALVILYLVLSLIAQITLVMPANQPLVDKQIAKGQAPGATPLEVSQGNMTKVMNQIALPMAIGQSVALMIYPIVLLILLNKPGARAACLPKKPLDLEEI